MLLTEFIMVMWNSRNKIWLERKGYVFTKMGDYFYIRVEDLMDGSGVKVNVRCDYLECNNPILNPMTWKNYLTSVKNDKKYYCQKCAMKMYGGEKLKMSLLKNSISFYNWCYINLSKELADYILSRWDYKLNIDKYGNVLSPKDISFSSGGFNRKGYWFKCLDHPEHVSEQKNISNFTGGEKGVFNCAQCNTITAICPQNLVEYFVNKEDTLAYSMGSHVKIHMKCPDCGYEKPMIVKNFINQGFGCPKCSDNVSYPNKFGFNFLDQIKGLNKIEDFKIEKTFDWLMYEFKGKLRQGFIDFYFELNGSNYGIEMDGGFHTNDNRMNGRTKEESQYIDDEKDRLCKEHNVKIIRINCEKSELEWIKNNVITSYPNLPELLNFKKEDINWQKCHEYACSSLVKVVCDLWNNGLLSVLKITSKLKRSRSTVVKYLKQGAEIGWCNYDGKIESIKNYVLHLSRLSIKVICLTTGEIFNSQIEAGIKYDIDSSGISKCCRNNTKQKSAGKHPTTNEHLKWQYYSEYIKSNPLPTAM